MDTKRNLKFCGSWYILFSIFFKVFVFLSIGLIVNTLGFVMVGGQNNESNKIVLNAHIYLRIDS